MNMNTFLTTRLLLLMALFCEPSRVVATDLTAGDYLSLGSSALAADMFDQAIEHYQKGTDILGKADELVTALSLYTNLGTSLSSLGREQEALEAYISGLKLFERQITKLKEDEEIEEAKGIAAQAAFFLAMVYQSLGRTRMAADTYAFANTVDPYHWASMGNLGAILHDELHEHEEALVAYNKAYEILTQTKVEPTDPPENPNFMLAELQYRIGLCINHDANRKCALVDDPSTAVPCRELATNAFATAVKYDPDHDSAKHMLATITADATMKRASNTYVKSLFDNYAKK
jgi:tetratricopeptide (TPR) repeat protein